jgi:hypothetical protein
MLVIDPRDNVQVLGGRSSQRQLTIRLHADRTRLLHDSNRFLAAGEAERYAEIQAS